MRQKMTMWVAVLVAISLAVIASSRVEMASAQESRESGEGAAIGVGGTRGAGESGGGGGTGGAGGYGGGGGFGGGGFGISGGGGGALAAFGDYVYVLHQRQPDQYAAYDLKLVKKMDDISADEPNNRARRTRGRNPVAGGAGGSGADGGVGGAGGSGGQGGGFASAASGFLQGDDVAAYGDFVYVLHGTTLRKLAADGLKPVKVVTLNLQ